MQFIKMSKACTAWRSPIFPGASWGDSIEETMKNAQEAIYFHVEAMREEGMQLLITQATLEDLAVREDRAGVSWALVQGDLSKLNSKPG